MIGWVQAIIGGMDTATFFGMVDPLMRLRPGYTPDAVRRMTIDEIGDALDAALKTEQAVAEARGRGR